ncbi:MAG: oligopeptide transporter, OPT family [Sedimentisphaerales bacterium]|nr:oligopeptide transporter, OPT family [Sedimentisphaerales bacterium]
MSLENRSLPEITIKAFILGVLLSMILAAANAYLGLFAGMTVSASIPAAVVSMGVLRLFRKSNILENNIVQTAASAGESLAAGVIFTLPALVIMEFWTEFNFFWITIIAGFGGILGVLFTIPLRRALIVEGKLKFPEGIATAEVLETGQQGGSGIRLIAIASAIGALFKIGAKGIGFWPEVVEVAGRVKSSIAYFGSNLSPALLSVGYIVGLNISILIFLGGAMNWYAAIPIVATGEKWPTYQLLNKNVPDDWDITSAQYGIINPNDPNVWNKDADEAVAWNVFALKFKVADPNASISKIKKVQKHNTEIKEKLGKSVDTVEYANQIWSKRTRYLGVGGMLLGGLWTIFAMRKSLFSGIASGLRAYKKMSVGSEEIQRTDKDMPMKWILVLIVASIVPLYIVYQYFVKDVTVSLPMAVVMLAAGFVFSAVAGYMAGLVGSSNNPISGVTIATVTVSALLLVVLMGRDNIYGPPAAIIIGSVVCCAAAIAGDNMQDLKAGQIVGATPWRQQVMQIVGTVSGALVIAPVLMLLHKAYGFRGQPGAGSDALSAVQANLMASVAKGVFKGDLPWTYVFIGMGIAAVVIALDQYLKKIGSSFRTPVLAVTIGIYLPLELAVPIFAGGLIHYATKRYHNRVRTPAEKVEASGRNGLLFASGLITGEALMGIILAIPIILLKQFDINLPIIEHFGKAMPFGNWIGAVLLIGVAYWLYKTVRGTKTTG